MESNIRIKYDKLYKQGNDGQIQIWKPTIDKWANTSIKKKRFFKLDLAKREEVEILYTPRKITFPKKVRALAEKIRGVLNGKK